jgi:probable HAF family extracellular repeat protein
MRHVGVRCSILAAAFLAVVPLGAVPSAIPMPDDLGSLGGSPFDVNPVGFGRGGTVVGASRTPGMPEGQQAPFAWTANGGFQVIAVDKTNPVNGVAMGANDLGQAVGYFSPLNSSIQGYLWTPPSGLVTIASPLAVAMYPHVVNHSAQVAGEFDSVDGSRHAFFWTSSGGFKDLGNLGGSTLTVSAITGNGLVVGYAQIATGETHAFQWKSGSSIKDLGWVGGYSYAYAANDAGLIAGTAQNGTVITGFIYQKGKFTSLASPSGSSVAEAMNSSGTAVGTDNNGNALVWPLGTAPTVITGGGIAYDINDAGQVALAMPTSPFYSYPTRAGFWSASTGLLDAGSDDEPHSAGFGVTSDGRLICKRDDWAGAHKAYVWQAGVPRKLLDGFPGAGFTRALFINTAGQVSGVSRTTLGYDRAFLWTPGGSPMVEVPAPTGFNSTPIAMNSSGHVIGSTMRGGTQPVSGPAFFWDGSATHDLGTTVLVDVNDSDTVLGEVTGPGGAGFIWKNNVTTTVAPSVPFYQVLPADINNLGQVVGTYSPDASSLKAFSWKAGVFTDLGTLGGSQSHAVAVNDSGLIAGNSMLTGDTVSHAFKTTAGKKMSDIGSLYGAGGTSTANAMNKNGVIVGSSSDSTHYHLFLYDGKMHDLGDPGTFDTIPGLNDLKDVVGWRLIQGTGAQAFVCLGGGAMTDLPQPPNQDESQAFAINNAGSAVGNALLKDGQRRALLWHCR